MSDITLGANGEAKSTVNEIPQKMKAFDEFVEQMRAVICQGTDKYAGAQKDAKETIDIIPEVLGEKGYQDFILGDLLKRIFRIKNQNRSRDIIKIAVWCYLYYLRFFYGKQK